MVFKRTEKGWSYEGIDLVMAREKLGLTQEKLAFRCKDDGGTWGQRNISHLETPGTHHIKQRAKEILEKALG